MLFSGIADVRESYDAAALVVPKRGAAKLGVCLRMLSSSARSTSRRTTVTPRSCARSSRSRGSTSLRRARRTRRRGHPGLRSNACCRARPTCGRRRHSNNASGSNNSSFRRNRVRQKGFVGTGVTAPAFSYLRTIEDENERVVDQNSGSWNPVASWLRLVSHLRNTLSF